MPKIVTKAFVDTVFFMPFTTDRTEGVFAVPCTRTLYNECRREALLEAGADIEQAESIAMLKVLERTIKDWKGFYTADGTEIPYSREILKDVWENDPAMFSSIYIRHREIARMGEAEDEKN